MSSGDDIFNGTDGNDAFDGDAGNDTVTIAGNAAGYRIDWVGNKVLLVDIDDSNGDTGTDTITGVEKLQFADGTFSLGTSTLSGTLAEVQAIASNSGSQATPSITTLTDGSSILVWEAGGIYAQRYDADGTANGAAKLLTAPFNSYQMPEIKPLADGGYAVLWASSTNTLRIQRFDANDAVVGTAFGPADMNLNHHAFTPLAGGGYVVTWKKTQSSDNSWDVEAQLFNASGSAVGGVFTVNATTSEDQYLPAITALSDGGFLVTWISEPAPFQGHDLMAQRFNASGEPVGEEIMLFENGATRPAVTALADGGYVVVWERIVTGTGDNVAVIQFDADGIEVMRETVNTTPTGWQEAPAVAALADGGYIVAWMSSTIDANNNNEGEEGDVYFQRYNADGAKVNGETLVNTTTAGWQTDVSIAVLPDGGFVISWESSVSGGDGNIYTQRYDADGNPVAIALQITGTALDDALHGGEGAQILSGLAGNDTLYGGTGNDIYVLSDADTVVEDSDSGTDTVQASISHTLGNNIEYLVLTGSAAINGTGNSLNNVITGNTAGNTLNGGAGIDTLIGGLGNDTYIIDSASDIITEASGAGTDTVSSTVSKTLGANLENLVLTGSAALSGNGNTLNNTLTGNTGANTLSASSGNDILNGGAGKDKLTGGSGLDKFVFSNALSASTNLDTITDFIAKDDTIQLENAVFKKLTKVGVLSSANFKASTTGKAADSNDFIVYETDTGKLFYDADGSGKGAAVQFATLVGHPDNVTYKDFSVI